MQIPEITKEQLEDCDIGQLAMLHCLRSIAVSLECLVTIQGIATDHIDDKAYDGLVSIVEDHSVGDRKEIRQ